MADPVPESTEQMEQEKQPSSHQKIKAKLIHWISYIAGDMKAFGEWMKGTRSRIVHTENEACPLIILSTSWHFLIKTLWRVRTQLKKQNMIGKKHVYSFFSVFDVCTKC